MLKLPGVVDIHTHPFTEENLAKFFRLNAIKAVNLEKVRPELVNRTQFKVIAK